MNRIIILVFTIAITQGVYGQGMKSVEILNSEDYQSDISDSEEEGVRSAVRKTINKYITYADLRDWETNSISNRMIDSFETICHPFVTLYKDYEYPAKNTTFSEYTLDAKAFFLEEGIQFELPTLTLESIRFDEQAGYFSVKASAEKTLKERVKNGEKVHIDKTFSLNFEFLVTKKSESYSAKIYSIIGKDESLQSQYEKQHSIGVLLGKSIFRGNSFEGTDVASPITIGLEYNYRSSLGFFPKNWSFTAGARLKYFNISTNINEGTTIQIDNDQRLNSITNIEFLSNGEEKSNIFVFEPVLGIDYKLSSSFDKRVGIYLAVTPRFVLNSNTNFVGSIAYSETFNGIVTVRDILSCGLRSFDEENSIDLEYGSKILNSNIGLLIQPYYQFETSYDRGIRIGLDFQYFFGTSFATGDRFLGNYNDALNPDVINRPELDLGTGSIIQTIGQNIKDIYVGLNVSYFFISK